MPRRVDKSVEVSAFSRPDRRKTNSSVSSVEETCSRGYNARTVTTIPRVLARRVIVRREHVASTAGHSSEWVTISDGVVPVTDAKATATNNRTYWKNDSVRAVTVRLDFQKFSTAQYGIRVYRLCRTENQQISRISEFCYSLANRQNRF